MLLLHPTVFELSYFHCHFFLEIFWFPFLISSVTCWLFRNMLFNLHVCVYYSFFSCKWYLVSYHCGQSRCLIWFQFLKFSEVWFVTQDVVYPGECSMCTWEEGVFFCVGWNVLKIPMRSISSKVSFKTCVSLLIFCFDDLSVGVSGVLKPPSIIVLLSISPFMSVSVCLMYWGVSMLGA